MKRKKFTFLVTNKSVAIELKFPYHNSVLLFFLSEFQFINNLYFSNCINQRYLGNTSDLFSVRFAVICKNIYVFLFYFFVQNSYFCLLIILKLPVVDPSLTDSYVYFQKLKIYGLILLLFGFSCWSSQTVQG